MTSVGVMASGVIGVSAVDALLEPFNNLTAWTTLGGAPSIVAGRTGTALSVAGTSAAVGYSIGGPQQSLWLTIGVAFRVSTLASLRSLMALWTDGGANNAVRVETNGAVSFLSGGTVQATSAAGLVVANTYYYLEAQIRLDVAAGSVELRLNGAQIAQATGINTNTSTGSLFQQVRIGPAGSGATQLYDDLYLTMGAGAAFKGPITIP
jgi:hypothetical protein